jgi:hypothetical protein
MTNTKFWGVNSEVIEKTPDKTNATVKIAKGLGATGIIVLVVVGLLAAVGYFVAIRPSYALISAVNKVVKDKDAVSVSLQNRDLVVLESNLVQTEKDLANVRTVRDAKFGWAKNVKAFKVSEFYSDSDRFVNAGFYAIDAMREMITLAKPFADAAGLKVAPDQQIKQEEGLMEAFQTWVSLMPKVAGQMDGVIAKVSKIGDELKPIETAKYPEKIKGFYVRSNLEFLKNTLSGASDYGPDIKKALTTIPALLGVGTPEKRYMIIMQNDKEIRPTGGFMTNYATFKIREGLLQSDFSSKDMYSVDRTLDIIDATYTFPRPPAAYSKYLKVERWYARDMNYSPDFVTSMDQFLIFYNMAGRIDPAEVKAVDGVAAIDTQVVKELLDVTGPVTVSGITYTSNNVVLELEKVASLELREQANRKKVLGNLMEAMLINVFKSDKNLWPKLIDKAVDLALRKHVQIYVFDPSAQALIEKYGFGGRIMDKVTGDYSMVVSTNLGADKTNWFVTKKVSHSLAQEGGKWIRTVKIDYSYKQPSDEFAPFVKRFKDWVRVYAPVGSTLISAEGSEDGTTTDQERNKVWFAGYLEMGPGESKSITFKYSLPSGTVGDSMYDLTIQKQAGTNGEVFSVDVFGKHQELVLARDTKISVRAK